MPDMTLISVGQMTKFSLKSSKPLVMAFRIDSIIERGEIDNTLQGCTTGKLWLANREEPISLLLEGDCWRDIAGSKLTFTNPDINLQPDISSGLLAEQKGVVGDITASRKVRIPTVPEEEWHSYFERREELPTEWKNCLYIEWFSESNGRVVIETTDFNITLSQREWTMDEDDQEAQKLANMQAMRDFMDAVIQRLPDSDQESENDNADEYKWEQRLQESDRLSSAYTEAMEKYIDDEASEQKEAFVMGWDNLLGEMADLEEGVRQKAPDWIDEAVEVEFEFDDEHESDYDEAFANAHPLQNKSRTLTIRIMEWTGFIKDNPAARDLEALMIQISGRLAGAFEVDADEPENSRHGYLLAITKRCINWCQEAVTACQQLEVGLNSKAQHDQLKDFLREIFALRDGLTDLRRSHHQK